MDANTLKPVRPFSWRDYLEICKPRVVALMLLTALVGMILAFRTTHAAFSYASMIFALVGIALTAGAAAAVNHLVDKRIDALMARTCKRPVVQGHVSVKQAIYFATIVGALGLSVLTVFVNTLTAVLTFISLIGYAGIYTGYLKRATPQNIVIGGLAGAAPPLLGWTAVSNSIDPQALLLVLIIFTWTPPHFWALAIYRFNDYKNAEIPMLPVTHGIPFTKLSIVLYTILMVLVSIMPFLIGMSGVVYLLGALGLGGRFLYWAIVLYKHEDAANALRTFRFSIIYLMALFLLLLVDNCIGV